MRLRDLSGFESPTPERTIRRLVGAEVRDDLSGGTSDHRFANASPAKEYTQPDSPDPPSWRGCLLLLTLAWPLLYGPAIYLYATGWRPPWPVLHQVLLTLCSVHTVALLTGWGAVALRDRWWHSQRRERLHMAQTLGELCALSPGQFEEWTAWLFEEHGYRVRTTTPVSDHGIDLRLTGPQGERAVVQCKRYKSTVGEAIIRDLYGTLLHTGADRGFLVTTGSISQAAREWARGKPLELIDGERLVRLAQLQRGPEGDGG